MDEKQQINGIGDRELLPHLKSPDALGQPYSRMVAPPEYGDQDFEVACQAERWAI